MRGRYGMDDLYNASMVACLALLCVGAFAKSTIVTMLILSLMILALARALSRNTLARSRENEKYLALTKPVRKRLAYTARSIRDAKTSRYRRCPGCKATICIPRRKGKRVIICPRCHTSFETRISFF
jgi:Uncharacterized paraquat-inducible protein A